MIEACYKISLVVTQPDRHKGRGLKLASTPIKDLAQQAGFKVFQPEDINSVDSVKALRELNPDLFVIIAYGQKLSQEVLGIARVMPINVHASILPKYRGAAPINWAIINGESQTGNTVMKVIPRMDAGPMIIQSQIDIDQNDDSITLEEKLSQDCGILLLKALSLIEQNNYSLIPQEEIGSSLAPKLSAQIAQINWNQPASRIHDLARGCLSWSAAFTKYKGKVFKIYKTQPDISLKFSPKALPGEIIAVSDQGLVVCTAKGGLIIQEFQLEAKKRVACKEFLCGNKIEVGEKLG